MDINKNICKSFAKNLFADPFDIKFWDGELIHFGNGKSKFKIILNQPLSKSSILLNPSLTLGEAFMNKTIDVEGSIEDVIESFYNNKDNSLSNSSKFIGIKKLIKNNIGKSKENVQFHYDIGNDFYKLWLDETMSYSCGYFKSPTDKLVDAQKNKINHILKKLNLKEGNTLLDIGCGWGELIITAAKEYNIKSMGITLSSEQYKKVKERIENEGLKDLVEVELIDYRNLKNRKFDRIVSVGMIEHVGKDYIQEYFKTVYDLLNDNGISLVHGITGRNEFSVNSWLNKYIFPGGYLPSMVNLVNTITTEGFYLIDLESLRMHYAITLEHWTQNFEKAIPEIEKMKDETFIRMWRLYLNACIASFKSGNIDIHQLLFTKGVNNNLPLTRDYIYK